MFVVGVQEGPLVLLIVKPTNNTRESPTVQVKTFGDDRIKGAGVFLIETSGTKLHDCELNQKTSGSVLTILRNIM